MAIAALIAVVCSVALVLINVGSDRDGSADGIRRARPRRRERNAFAEASRHCRS
jgi:hypothetical protein